MSKYPRRSNFQIIEQFDFLLPKIDTKWKKWFWIEIAFFLYRIFEQKSCSIVVVRFKCGKIKEWSKSRIWFVSRPQENVPFILNKIYHGVHGYEITSFGDRYGTPRFWMIVLFTILLSFSHFDCIFDFCKDGCVFPKAIVSIQCRLYRPTLILFYDSMFCFSKDEFYLRWLEISNIEIKKAAYFSKICNHLSEIALFFNYPDYLWFSAKFDHHLKW